jgi:hypothetical protein
MQLTYRGVHYEYNPRGAEAAREATVFRAIRPAYNLHYRGSVYAVDPNAEPSLPASQPAAQLMYRGAAYALNGWTKPAANVQSTSSVASSSPRFSKKASGHTEFTTVHRTNLHTNIQRRLQVARERGDQNLINLLERELQQIA